MLKNLEIALNEAIQDEYKACETYRLVMEKFGFVRPFVNIIEAEKRHIQALIILFRKYQLPIPINTWGGKIEVPNSLLEACLGGVQAEIENGEMYVKLLNLTKEYPDVQRVFLNLQRASQQNHLRAFQRAAQKYSSNETSVNFDSNFNHNYQNNDSNYNTNFSQGNSRRCGNRNRWRGGKRFSFSGF